MYLNGNNAAEGENNIKYANSYPMNWTVKNCIGLGALWDWIGIACKCPFIDQNLNLIYVLQAAIWP